MFQSKHISYIVTKCIWDFWVASRTRLRHVLCPLNIPCVIICDTTVLPAPLVGSVTSTTAVNELCQLGQSLLCWRGLCQASAHHVEHSGIISVKRRDRESQSLCFDTRDWQSFVIIPPHSAWLYSCYLSSKWWQEPSSSLFVLPPLPFSHLFMSFRLRMFLVPVYLVMFDKTTSNNRARWFRYTNVSDTDPSTFIRVRPLSFPLFPQHIYSFVI
jgi:hypothetical protein